MDKEIKQKTEETEKLSGLINRIAEVLLQSSGVIMVKLRQNLEEAIRSGDLDINDLALTEYEESSFFPADTELGLSNSIGEPFTSVKISGLNVKKGLKHFGDTDEYIRILRSYTASTRSRLASLQTVNEENLSKYEISVHGIKGASNGIFADNVGKLAGALENAAVVGDLDFINENNPPFLDAAYTLVRDLEKLFNKIDSAKPRLAKEKPDKALLMKLQSACQMYDIEVIEATMEQIGSCQYETDNDLVAWLKENVEVMNYELIVERLSAAL